MTNPTNTCSQGGAADASNLVPGQMHCARCKFQLTRTVLYMGNGAVGAGDSKTEPCPNGCGPLWPVTWEQAAREAWATNETLFERAKAAEDALAAVHPPRLVAAPASAQEAPRPAGTLTESDDYGQEASGARLMLLASTPPPPEAMRLMTMLLGAFGSHHPAVTDLVTLVLKGTPAPSAAVQQGETPRKFVRWGDCRCILTKYCDGQCNPIYADPVAISGTSTPEPNDTPLETGEGDAR